MGPTRLIGGLAGRSDQTETDLVGCGRIGAAGNAAASDVVAGDSLVVEFELVGGGVGVGCVVPAPPCLHAVVEGKRAAKAGRRNT